MLSLTQSDVSMRKLYSRYTDNYSNFFKWRRMQVHFKDEGDGIPILFLHGTSSSLHTWDELAKLLKSKYRVIRMDLIGCGITGPHPKSNYSMEMYLSFINDFTHFLELDEFIIAGNSWGGMLAWNYAALRPKLLSGLILINSAGFKMSKTPKRFKLVQFKAGRWLLKKSTPKWVVKKGLKEVIYSDQIEERLTERYQALMLREGNRRAFVDLMMTRQQPKTELLASIKIPTLLLWGRHDKLYPLHQANLFQKQIRNAQLKIIEK
ncbi:alpha/beta fold hydrolase [Ulvibacterium marinum]|uniref:alpha/beta fold hydrolase n=1 Tax=Ulvibacterium marinum TaxID=2419782 RepID=UPI0024942CA5|nr:alpha/beta hydrolase [Ulvibacterium marinum]